jgi:polyhydroxyalkanoate synthesis regulator phasin
MGKMDWSVDQLEHDLASSFALLGRMEQGGALAPGESAALADGVMRCMNGALLKVSESLETQSLLRRELDAMREELSRTGSAHQAFMQAQDKRIHMLEDEVKTLRAQSLLAEDALRHFPSDEFLSRPLVVRSSQGDFLGLSVVAGQPLCMGDFVRLVEQGGDQRRIVCTLWEERGSDWFLTMSLSGQGAAYRRCYVLETRAVLTPSGNHVTELVSMAEDGVPVSDDFLLQMFRQLRETLQE